MHIVSALAYVAMIVVNTLAWTLPLNGVTTGEVSDAFPNLFVPADFTFAVWGPIYLLLGLFAAHRLGLLGKRATGRPWVLVDTLFTVTSLANIGWVFAWHHWKIGLSLVCMAVLLGSLAYMGNLIGARDLTGRERALVSLPIGMYFGWITVATVANATALLIHVGFDGFGISPSVWTVVVLGLVIGIAIAEGVTIKNPAYPLPVIWAFVGIAVRHQSQAGFDGAYPGIVLMATAGALILLSATLYIVAERRFPDRLRETSDDGTEAPPWR